jgi:tetratricopeptide (TPR) repeat protein
MRLRAFPLATITAALLIFPVARTHAQGGVTSDVTSNNERAAFHQDPQWLMIAPHLPDPNTATSEQLEMAADVLQARRFPEDALDYYGFALKRGGPSTELLNKMGVIRLELREVPAARALFQQTVKLKKKDPVGWNNLGVTEYMDKQYRSAIVDYGRASRLDKKSAVYHTNLGMAYFENHDMEGSRKEFAVALRLDPQAFSHGAGSGGSAAQVVGSQNYAELAFEMARVYAKHHNDEATVLWLGKATEGGFDTKNQMMQDSVLAPYVKDPRVILMLKNAKELKTRAVAAAPVQSLGAASGDGPAN